jgi:hypothetical protein
LTPPLSYVGVTLIVAVIGELPVFTAVNEGMLPVPEATKPIETLLLVQAYVFVPPEFVEPKVIAAIAFPLQTSMLVGFVTFALGLTVIVKVLGEPVQLEPPLVNVGVTVIVAITGELTLLIAAKEVISPLPEATKPMEGVLFVQL